MENDVVKGCGSKRTQLRFHLYISNEGAYASFQYASTWIEYVYAYFMHPFAPLCMHITNLKVNLVSHYLKYQIAGIGYTIKYKKKT